LYGAQMNSFDPQAYWESRLSSNPGLRGVGFTSLGRNYNQWLYRIRRRVFLREVGSLPIHWRAARVLDVGAGTGFYIQLWGQLGVASVTGADLTSVAVARLRKRFPGNEFLQLDIGAPLDDCLLRSFDIVSALDVLFHIVNDDRYRAAISNIHSLLRPGGWFIFSDQLLHSPTRRAMHQVDRSMGDVMSALEMAGFEVVRRKPMFVLMNYPLDATGRGPAFLWRAVTYPVRKSKLLTGPLGEALGAVLYPFEVVLTKFLREGPSTEIVICRKPLQTNDGIADPR
jgi:SAM-dependent methyltransferase